MVLEERETGKKIEIEFYANKFCYPDDEGC